MSPRSSHWYGRLLVTDLNTEGLLDRVTSRILVTDLNTEHEMFPQSDHCCGRFLMTDLNTEVSPLVEF